MELIWRESAELLALGQEVAACNVFPIYNGPFSLVNDDGAGGDRKDVELVSAAIFKVTSATGDDNYASVVLCRVVDDKPQWAVYCGDDQISGKHRADGKTLAARLRAEGKVANALANQVEAQDWVAKIPDQAGCGFFRMQERTKRLCSHTQAVLNQMTAEQLEQMATDLVGWKSGSAVTFTAAPGVMSAEEEAFYDAAFVQHVLLAGERGAGKTYLARAAADKEDAVYLEMQCHPSMEPWEFRAHDRAWNGKVYTVLGKLAEAVFWIQAGKKVVLCLDEFMNMNPMYATTINSPLSLTADDKYLIETGRIIDQGDGIGTPEVVAVPSEMLWVVATSNVGARYGLDKIAPSVRARFQIILMNTNADRTRKILEKQLGSYDMPLEIAEKFEKFITVCNGAVEENNLDEEVTTRLAVNVIRAVHKKAVRDKKRYSTVKQWLPVIKKQVEREIAQVVSFETGPLHPEQEELFKTFVNACFK